MIRTSAAGFQRALSNESPQTELPLESAPAVTASDEAEVSTRPSSELRVGDLAMLKVDMNELAGEYYTFAARKSDTDGFGLTWLTMDHGQVIDRPPNMSESVFMLLRSGHYSASTKLRKLKEMAAHSSEHELTHDLTALEAAVQSEELINSMQAKRDHATLLHYGDSIMLQHVSSGFYLSSPNSSVLEGPLRCLPAIEYLRMI